MLNGNSDKQRTIKQAVTVSGKGIHTGKLSTLTFKPAPPNHGFVFKRIDLVNQPEIKADVDNVTDVSRGTTIEQNGAKVKTIEHVLAALAGLQLDNVLMEIDGPEVPIMDGSSKPFIDVLLYTGIVEQDAKRIYFKLSESVFHWDRNKDVEMTAVPCDDYEVTVNIDYNSKTLGKQSASLKHINQFTDEISHARTFCFLHEVQFLVNNNLIRGGDLDNAIVVVDKKLENGELHKLQEYFNKPNIAVDHEGILNNVELRYTNEPARHKLLDVVGDLALVGVPIKARIIGNKPGHSTNVAFAKKIKKMIKEQRNVKEAPSYDPNETPIYDARKIEQSLPHKYPFLLVDKIIELSDSHVVGIKNVTFNEYYFQGHFPGNPIMPGVLQIEAMAQTGGILVLNTVTDPENWDTYFFEN